MGKGLGMRAERKRQVGDEAAIRQAITAMDARLAVAAKASSPNQRPI